MVLSDGQLLGSGAAGQVETGGAIDYYAFTELIKLCKEITSNMQVMHITQLTVPYCCFFVFCHVFSIFGFMCNEIFC